MPKLDYTPTFQQVKSARRLMALAELGSVRLMEAHTLYSPSARRILPGVAHGQRGLHLKAAAIPRGKRLKQGRLEVVIKYSAIARRGAEPKAEVALRIRARFELVYMLPRGMEPGSREISAFSKTNAMLNSWPYWREFVQNLVARMNLPPLTLPLFRLAPPPKASMQPEARPARG